MAPARVTSPDERAADELVVPLEGSPRHLSNDRVRQLRAWAAQWQRRDPERTIVMGCDAPASRAWRVQRLREVRACVEQGGVPLDRIRYTADTIEVGSVRPQHLPHADAVWLRAVPSALLVQGIRPIRSLVRPGGAAPRKESPCTTASWSSSTTGPSRGRP